MASGWSLEVASHGFIIWKFGKNQNFKKKFKFYVTPKSDETAQQKLWPPYLLAYVLLNAEYLETRVNCEVPLEWYITVSHVLREYPARRSSISEPKIKQ